MTKTISEREIAFATLYEITENGVYSHVILGEVLNKYQYLEKRERAFITRVVEGTLEHEIKLDYILDQFSKTKTRKMKPVIRCILRMAVWKRIPITGIMDLQQSSQMVKSVLRRA